MNWDKIAEGLVDGAKRYIDARFVEMEKRLSVVEKKPALEYRGVWSSDETYEPGHVVTDSGSMFIAVHPSRMHRPGSSGDWKLCVKRGRDGKDARS
jgi:hypothetical protein